MQLNATYINNPTKIILNNISNQYSVKKSLPRVIAITNSKLMQYKYYKNIYKQQILNYTNSDNS